MPQELKDDSRNPPNAYRRENFYPFHQEGKDRFYFMLKFVLSIFVVFLVDFQV